MRFQAAILTASDKGARGEREDQSGNRAEALLQAAGYEVCRRVMVPDDRDQIAAQLCEFAALDLALVLTTGGTGFSPRDCTPEATLAVIERQVPGIPEAMRSFSLQITKRALLSRAVAGIRGRTLIINLPGSPKAVEECLGFVLPELEHGLKVLRGQSQECAR